jgi:hypothetical protein
MERPQAEDERERGTTERLRRREETQRVCAAAGRSCTATEGARVVNVPLPATHVLAPTSNLGNAPLVRGAPVERKSVIDKILVEGAGRPALYVYYLSERCEQAEQ